jgi:hypothetical protein
MLSRETAQELQSAWLPNTTDVGLDRLIELLSRCSPLLIHGCFTRSVPMGCLASHIAWNHPATQRLTLDAGIMWLSGVAGLNPATSAVLKDWDRCGHADMTLRSDLLALLRAERERRQSAPAPADADLTVV